MRTLVLLLALAAAPAFGQASSPSRSGRSASLVLPVRTSAASAEMLTSSAIYSWVDEADGRYVARQADYLRAEERTAWAAGEDDAPRLSHLASGDTDWPETTVVTCDVLKCCVPSRVHDRPARPAPRSTRS